MWANIYSHGQKYLDENKTAQKWINQCVNCQDLGYKPEMPKLDPEFEFKNIRKRFKCLPINEFGVCEICR